ncbi:MAG: glycosyltransferase family 4 protein [Terriglobia bacterium]
MSTALRRHTILHTIEGSGPGGAETVLLELASRVDPDRYRSLVYLPEGTWLPQQLRARGVPCIIYASTTWHGVIRDMMKVVKSEGVDLIHSHLDDQNFAGSVVGLLTGRKTVVTYHGAPRLARQQGLRRRIKIWVPGRFAAATVVVSDYLRNQFIDAGFPSARTHRIYNGVDLDRFAPGVEPRLRAELGLDPGSRLVGMVANVRRTKGHEYFIRAAGNIAQRVPEARFLAVGDVDERLGTPLRKLVGELDLQDRFLFLGFRPDVPAILKELDVFVLASTDEGLSIATLEAMAAARPVVVTRSGGPQELVTDGETGFIIPAADPEALAARVCDILRDPGLAKSLGAGARDSVASRFSLRRMVGEYQSLYERCLAGN